jgi:hypothetical protein
MIDVSQDLRMISRKHRMSYLRNTGAQTTVYDRVMDVVWLPLWMAGVTTSGVQSVLIREAVTSLRFRRKGS